MFTENVCIALTYAARRAMEDKSIGIIIEITKVEDFNIKNEGSIYYVKGILKKGNHKIYMKEELEKLLPILKKQQGLILIQLKNIYHQKL